jgi:hypothetical protein
MSLSSPPTSDALDDFDDFDDEPAAAAPPADPDFDFLPLSLDRESGEKKTGYDMSKGKQPKSTLKFLSSY